MLRGLRTLWSKAIFLPKINPAPSERRFHLACVTRSSMQLEDVVQRLNKLAPTFLAGSWDNVGLLLEPSAPHQVSKLLLTNDLTEPVLEEALHKGVQMILSYHPPIFVPFKRLTQASWKERIIVKCAENRIAVFSPHTSYDAVKGGVNDWLISPFVGSVSVIEEVTSVRYPTPGKFQIEATIPTDQSTSLVAAIGVLEGVQLTTQNRSGVKDDDLRIQANCTKSGLTRALVLLQEQEKVYPTVQVIHLTKPPIPGQGPGRVCKLTSPIRLQEAVDLVKSHLKLPHVRVAQAVGTEKDAQITSVAVCAGSGASVLRNVAADLYITGEMSHHEVLDAVHGGHHVILCDHSNTERGYLDVVQCKLTELLNNKVEIFISDKDKDPLDIV